MASKIIDAIIRLKDMLTPNMARIRQELSETQKAARRASRDIKNIGSTVSSIGNVMLPAATAITGGIGYAAKQFADFSYSITRTAHIAGASAEGLERLKQTAISVGSELPMTINETAEAMMKLASAGFDEDQIVGSFRSIAMAAEASGADITLVSDTISNALSVWDLKSKGIEFSSARVADAVQAATNKSKLSFDKFAVELQGGGNIAASFGESIERTTALMGTL